MGEISAEAGSKAVEMWRPLEFNTQLATITCKRFLENLFPLFSLIPCVGHLADFGHFGFWSAYSRDEAVSGVETHRRSGSVQPRPLYGLHYDCVGFVAQADVLYDSGRKFPHPVVKQIIRVLGAVPQSNHPHRTKELFSQLETALKNGAAVQIYPERVLRPYYNLGTRKMQRGAFKMAVEANVPMLPMVVTYREPKGLYRLFKKKPCMDLTILDPIHPPKADTPQESARLLQNQVEEAMNREMQKHPYSFGNSKKESARKMILARRQKNFTFFPSSLCVGEGFSAFSGEIGKRICPERSSVL